MAPTTEVSQRQHEQIQMQVKKHIPRYPNPLIFAFLHFMNTTRENDFIWRLVVPGVVMV